MKKLIILLTFSLLCIALCGCGDSEAANGVPNASGNESDTSLQINPRDIFSFASSEYTVTSQKEYNGIAYETVYFLVEDQVAGARISVTYSSEEEAKDHYNMIADDYEYILRKEMTVEYYSDDEDDVYCYGESFEKLKYSLKLSGYYVTVNFNEKEYFKRYSDNER